VCSFCKAEVMIEGPFERASRNGRVLGVFVAALSHSACDEGFTVSEALPNLDLLLFKLQRRKLIGHLFIHSCPRRPTQVIGAILALSV
jgi:hypothetical protein